MSRQTTPNQRRCTCQMITLFLVFIVYWLVFIQLWFISDVPLFGGSVYMALLFALFFISIYVLLHMCIVCCFERWERQTRAPDAQELAQMQTQREETSHKAHCYVARYDVDAAKYSDDSRLMCIQIQVNKPCDA